MIRRSLPAAHWLFIAAFAFFLYGTLDAVVSQWVPSAASAQSWQAVSGYAAFGMAIACCAAAIPLDMLRDRGDRRTLDRPRPDYSLIAAMEREIYGETFKHDGAPLPPPRVVSGPHGLSAPRACGLCGIPGTFARGLCGDCYRAHRVAGVRHLAASPGAKPVCEQGHGDQIWVEEHGQMCPQCERMDRDYSPRNLRWGDRS